MSSSMSWISNAAMYLCTVLLQLVQSRLPVSLTLTYVGRTSFDDSFICLIFCLVSLYAVDVCSGDGSGDGGDDCRAGAIRSKACTNDCIIVFMSSIDTLASIGLEDRDLSLAVGVRGSFVTSSASSVASRSSSVSCGVTVVDLTILSLLSDSPLSAVLVCGGLCVRVDALVAIGDRVDSLFFCRCAVVGGVCIGLSSSDALLNARLFIS